MCLFCIKRQTPSFQKGLSSGACTVTAMYMWCWRCIYSMIQVDYYRTLFFHNTQISYTTFLGFRDSLAILGIYIGSDRIITVVQSAFRLHNVIFFYNFFILVSKAFTYVAYQEQHEYLLFFTHENFHNHDMQVTAQSLWRLERMCIYSLETVAGGTGHALA